MTFVSASPVTGDLPPVIYRAAAALPHRDRERATAGLCSQLRVLAAAGGGMLDWQTLTVHGPTEVHGPGGTPWFEWSATITVVGGHDLTRDPVDELLLAPTGATGSTVDLETRPHPVVG